MRRDVLKKTAKYRKIVTKFAELCKNGAKTVKLRR